MTEKDELNALRKRVEELEAKAKPPAPIDWERRIAEHNDQVHQMREGRMAHASNFHPDDLRAMEAACPTSQMKEIALRDARAPTGRPGMIPNSGAGDPRPSAGDGKGYVDPRPLGPQPGIHWVDAQLIADDVRQRAELRRKLGK
jgi:hypothetical protein